MRFFHSDVRNYRDGRPKHLIETTFLYPCIIRYTFHGGHFISYQKTVLYYHSMVYYICILLLVGPGMPSGCSVLLSPERKKARGKSHELLLNHVLYILRSTPSILSSASCRTLE